MRWHQMVAAWISWSLSRSSLQSKDFNVNVLEEVPLGHDKYLALARDLQMVVADAVVSMLEARIPGEQPNNETPPSIRAAREPASGLFVLFSTPGTATAAGAHFHNASRMVSDFGSVSGACQRCCSFAWAVAGYWILKWKRDALTPSSLLMRAASSSSVITFGLETS